MKKYKLKMVPTKQGAFVRRRIDKTRARAEFVGMLYLLAMIALTGVVCAPLLAAERYHGGITVFYKTLLAFNYSTVADAVKLVTAALYALMLFVLVINVLRSLTHLKYLFKKKVSRVYGLNSNISAMEALGQIFSSSLIWIVATQFISYMICLNAQFTYAALVVAIVGVVVHILGGFMGGKVSAFYIDDEEGVREVKRPYGRIIPLVRNILQIAAVGAIGFCFTKTDLYVITSSIAEVVYARQWGVLWVNVMGMLPALADMLIGLCIIAMARYALGTYEYSVEGEYSPDGVRGVSSACFKGGAILTVLLSAFAFVYRFVWGGISSFAKNEAGVFEPVFHGNSTTPNNYFDIIPLCMGVVALVIFLIDVCVRWRWTKAAKEEQQLGMVERRPVPPRVEVKMPAIQPAPVNVKFPKQEIVVRVPKLNPTPINVNVPKAAPIKLPDITVNVPKSAPIKLPDINVHVPKAAPIKLPDINVTVPKQDPTPINVNIPKQDPIKLPDITVNVPKPQMAPINVNIPKQDPIKLPDITVNVPKAAPIRLPDINVTVPKQDPTPINVHIPKQEPVKLPDITVNVPKPQMAPINVNIPKQEPVKLPDVVVNVPKQAPTPINVNIPKQEPVKLPDVVVNVPKQDPTPINVHIPKQEPVKLPDITVNVPKQQVAPISVNIPKMATPALPPITVNVPKQNPAPIQVNVPKQASEIPTINVNIPKQSFKPVVAIPANVSKRSGVKEGDKRAHAAQQYGNRDFELYVAPGTETDGISVAAQSRTKTKTPIIVNVPKQAKAEATPIVVNVPKQGKAEATPIVVTVPKQGKEETTPIVVNVPKQGKAEATPIVVTVPKQGKEEATPIVVTVPKQGKEETTPIVVTVPKQGKAEATPIVVNVPKQAKAEAMPIVVNVPKQAKAEATPIVVNVPKQAKAEATPIVVNVPKQAKAEATPIVVNVPKQAKAEATPIVVNVPKQEKQEATPIVVNVPKQEKQEATPIVVNVPKQEKQEATPIVVNVPKQEKQEATPIVVNMPKQNVQPTPVNIYMPKQKMPAAQTADNAELEALRQKVAELESKLEEVSKKETLAVKEPVNVQEKTGMEGEGVTTAPTNNYRPFIMPQQPMMAPVMMMPPPQVVPAPVPEVKEEVVEEPVVERVPRDWEIKCPNCGKLLRINDKSSYHRCPACTKVFQSETKGRTIATLSGINASAKKPSGMKDGLPTTLPPKKD